MADCRVVNKSMVDTVERISQISDDYKRDGEDFMTALNEAISPMEGETKDALNKFFGEKVQPFLTQDVPEAIKSTSKLLEGNRTSFISVDSQIAESINSGS